MEDRCLYPVLPILPVLQDPCLPALPAHFLEAAPHAADILELWEAGGLAGRARGEHDGLHGLDTGEGEGQMLYQGGLELIPKGAQCPADQLSRAGYGAFGWPRLEGPHTHPSPANSLYS